MPSYNLEVAAPQKKRCGAFTNFRFPVAAYIILIHELLERFSYYGFKSVLSLYLNQYLGIPEDKTTIIYHLAAAVAYLMPVAGAIIADNYWGRFKTVVILGIIYLIGHATMSLTALRKNMVGPIVGTFVLSIGTGGIKACVAAFGGDQIPAKETEKVETYFSLFYMAINIGAVISMFISPMLRAEVKCIDNQCFPLAFGVPAVAFLLTYILFIAAKPTYTFLPPQANVVTKFVRCTVHSIRRWGRERKQLKKKDLLDYADDSFEPEFIMNCKKAFSVVALFSPFPIYWAMFDQQGSRWTLQAKKMDGFLTNDYSWKPDQMQMLNPFLIIFSIPLFEIVIYPLLARCRVLTSPTSRIILGYILASAAFIYAGFIQIAIDKGLPTAVPATQTRLQLVNAIPNCVLNVSSNAWPNPIILNDTIEEKFQKFLVDAGQIQISAVPLPGCPKDLAQSSFKQSLDPGTSATLFIGQEESELVASLAYVKAKAEGGEVKVRIVTGFPIVENVSFVAIPLPKTNKLGEMLAVMSNSNNTALTVGNYVRLRRKRYLIQMHLFNQTKYHDVGILNIDKPSIMSVVVTASNTGYSLVAVTELKFEMVHMFYQIPQYVILTCSEVLFSVTAMTFAYTEAPASMKSLMQSTYLVTIFFGNILVVIISPLTEANFGLAGELFFYAAFGFLGCVINGVLVYLYTRAKERREELEGNNAMEMEVHEENDS